MQDETIVKNVVIELKRICKSILKDGFILKKAEKISNTSPLEKSYELIAPPKDLSNEERDAWEYFISILRNGTRYKKTLADVELIRQFVQHKVMRDKAWQEWSKKPERYIRIVTGVCPDGTTPKIIVKENEHYRILNDCNKYIERLWNDLKLTPKDRYY